MITDLNIIIRIWITLLGRPVNKVADVLNKTYGGIDEAWFAAENDDRKVIRHKITTNIAKSARI